MYFTDADHESNFDYLVNEVFARSAQATDYKAYCYILALPDIYKRCIKNPDLIPYPLQWIFEYNRVKRIDDESGEEYFEAESILDDEGNEIYSDDYNTLSSGYKQILHAGMHFYNSRNTFVLMDGFDIWSDNLKKTFYQALAIRTGDNIRI